MNRLSSFFVALLFISAVNAQMNMGGGKNRTLGVILFPGFAVLDVFGPLEFWNALSTSKPIQLALIANQTGLVSSKSPDHMMPGGMMMSGGFGESIQADYDFDTAPHLDILLVPGGMGTRNLVNDTRLINFIKNRYPDLEYLVSVCTGAALVAKTGLMDFKNATTNKYSYEWATAQGPNVNWIPHARFVQDGNILSSSGVTAGMDLTYYFVSKLYGEDTAARIANVIEYAPHKDASWDPFSDIWLKAGNNSYVAASPCAEKETPIQNITECPQCPQLECPTTKFELTSAASTFGLAISSLVALVMLSM